MLTVDGVRNFGKVQLNSLFHKLMTKAIVRHYVHMSGDGNVVHGLTIQNGKLKKHLYENKDEIKINYKIKLKSIKI